MIILSRQARESIMVNSHKGSGLITVLTVRGDWVTLLISHSPANVAGDLNSWTVDLARDQSQKIGPAIEATVIDIRAEKARLGIVAPKETQVHRLEVWQAIKQEQNRGGGDDADGPAGSRVPRPGGPRPPDLHVRLDEPKPEEDA